MIFVDVFEPKEVETLIAQTVETLRLSLNHAPQGFADYLFFAHDGHRIQVERKQIGEILSDIDGVEEQLGRELSNGVEETILLIEGFCEPIPAMKMAVQSWKMARGGKVMVPAHKYNVSYTGLQAWKSQLDKAGITIVEGITDATSTAMTLVALYNNAQKKEHTTLRRYIKEHIVVQPFNEHVITLMGIKSASLGEARAKALIERYGTVWYVLNQGAEDIADTLVGEEGKEKKLGLAVARKLLKAIGKEH